MNKISLETTVTDTASYNQHFPLHNTIMFLSVLLNIFVGIFFVDRFKKEILDRIEILQILQTYLVDLV